MHSISRVKWANGVLDLLLSMYVQGEFHSSFSTVNTNSLKQLSFMGNLLIVFVSSFSLNSVNIAIHLLAM